GARADGDDAAAEVIGAAVVEIVTGHGSDHHVLEPQPQRSLGDALRLIVLEGLGRATRDRTEAAWPGADVAQDHEGRSSPRVAFRPVRAAGVLTHRFQAQLAQEILREEIAVALGQLALQPGRQPPRGARSSDNW